MTAEERKERNRAKQQRHRDRNKDNPEYKKERAEYQMKYRERHRYDVEYHEKRRWYRKKNKVAIGEEKPVTYPLFEEQKKPNYTQQQISDRLEMAGKNTEAARVRRAIAKIERIALLKAS